jgi:hypothetical protein
VLVELELLGDVNESKLEAPGDVNESSSSSEALNRLEASISLLFFFWFSFATDAGVLTFWTGCSVDVVVGAVGVAVGICCLVNVGVLGSGCPVNVVAAGWPGCPVDTVGRGGSARPVFAGAAGWPGCPVDTVGRGGSARPVFAGAAGWPAGPVGADPLLVVLSAISGVAADDTPAYG